jgi:hypothetical protein
MSFLLRLSVGFFLVMIRLRERYFWHGIKMVFAKHFCCCCCNYDELEKEFKEGKNSWAKSLVAMVKE